MIRSEKAVSEVIGMVLILGIMMLVIGIIMLGAVPMIESARYRARMDVAMNSFQSLQNDIEETVRGPIWVKDPLNVANINRLGPSRETEFQLMGGMLRVVSNETSAPGFMILNVSDISHNENNITISGGIIYTADREEIAYENGAVIRKYESGAGIMISYPLITIYNTLDNNTYPNAIDNTNISNISVSIHAINISGRLSSVGGSGMAWIETRPRNYSQIIPPNSTNQMNITIKTKYPEAWATFFDKKLNEAGLVRDNNNNLTGYNISEIKTSPLSNLSIRIYGNYNSSTKKDILVSVYETELDIKVR